MDDLLNEHGIFYSHKKDTAPDYYIGYSYQRRYLGEVVDNTVVYCKNARDFVELIRHWNRVDGKWLYVLV